MLYKGYYQAISDTGKIMVSNTMYMYVYVWLIHCEKVTYFAKVTKISVITKKNKFVFKPDRITQHVKNVMVYDYLLSLYLILIIVNKVLGGFWVLLYLVFPLIHFSLSLFFASDRIFVSQRTIFLKKYYFSTLLSH